MKVVDQIEAIARANRPVVVVPGAFDGLHLGHQALIQKAREQAKINQGEVWVLTMDPHPSRILRPEAPAPQLMTTKQKLNHLKRHGVDCCMLLPFSSEFSQVTAEVFLERLAGGESRLTDIVTGPNYRFGHQARGCTDLLKQNAATYGYAVHLVDPIQQDGAMVSSSRIRKTLAEGDIRAANRMLGHDFSVVGPVVKGKQLGRQLGFPTANLACANDVRPRPGVYAVYMEWEGVRVDAAGYFAPEPSPHIFEAHFFDFEADLYGCELEVFFVRKIRDDIRFETPEALVAQIEKDVAEIRAFFEQT